MAGTFFTFLTSAYGSLDMSKYAMGTLPAQYISKAAGTLSAARNAGSLVRGTLAAQHHPLLQNLAGTLSIITKTSGSINIATRALGTIANQRLPRSPSFGTIVGIVNAGSLNRGSVPTNRYVSGSGTLAGARNAGSLARGTISIPRLQLLQNVPGTIGIVVKTSGTLNIATRALGTLANQRLPRTVSVGTLVGNFNAGSLNRGTVPSNRYVSGSGTLAGARNAGSLVRGTVGASRLQVLQNIPGTLGIVSKTSGTLNIATRALGTLANSRLPRSISAGTVTALLNAGSLTRGTVPSNRYVSGGGTLAGARNAGSLVRGTILAAQLQTLPNIPGTLSAVSKTSGSLNMATRAVGTLAAQRVGQSFSKNVAIINPGTVTILAWRPPVPVTMTGVRMGRVSFVAGNIQVDILKNLTGSPHMTGTPIINSTTTGSWAPATSLKGTKVALGSSVWVQVKRITGTAYQVAVHMDFTSP